MKAQTFLALILLSILSASCAGNSNIVADNSILKRPVANTSQTIIEKANVRELIEFERFSRDSGLWDEMKGCYADNSRVNISWFQGTGHGFVDATAALQGMPSAHKIYSTEIWLNGGKAVAIMQANVQMRYVIDRIPVELKSDVKLIFRTQKIDGRWYIVHFESIYEKDMVAPIFPTNDLNIPVDEIAKLRSSYGSMIYLATKHGIKVDENLAGTDRPDLVEKLYRATNEWFTQE